jgi:hypothetical protein
MSRQNALETLVGRMTLSELSDRSGRSVESIVDWAMGSGSGASPRKAAASVTDGRPARRTKAADTRSKQGRDTYDQAVLTTVRGASGAIGASAIRKQVGGTPLQVRAALNRLIERGAVTYQGRARATRYSPA